MMASENPDDAVATYLRQRLDESGMTSAALARELGVSKNTVTNWTKGKHRPQRKHAEAIAVALNTSPEAFLSGPEDGATDPEAQSAGGEQTLSAEVPAHSDAGEETPSGETAGKKRNAEESDRRPSRGTTRAGIALVVGLLAAVF